MSTWALEITGDTHRTIIGVADTAAGSRADALRAIGAVNAAAGFQHHRYQSVVDGELVAIIQTGTDDAGLPDHRGIVDLLDRISHTPPSPGVPIVEKPLQPQGVRSATTPRELTGPHFLPAPRPRRTTGWPPRGGRNTPPLTIST